jgi:hypothetical protein
MSRAFQLKGETPLFPSGFIWLPAASLSTTHSSEQIHFALAKYCSLAKKLFPHGMDNRRKLNQHHAHQNECR